MHLLAQVFRSVIQLLVGNAECHLGRALGTGYVVEHEVHPVQFGLLGGLVDQPGWGNDADGAIGHILAQAGVHIAFGIARQVAAKLVERAPRHGRAHHDVFAGGFFHKACRCHDGNLALCYFLGRHHAQHAAKVVGVGMGQHHRRHRLVAQVLAGEGQRGAGGLRGRQRVDQNPAGLAFDDGHVGNVKAAQLVHAVHDLEQAIVGVQLGVAPQAGVDRVGGLALQEVVGVKVFENRAVRRKNFAGRLGHEAALGIFKVLRIVKLQILRKLGVYLECFRRGVARCATDAAGFAAAGC